MNTSYLVEIRSKSCYPAFRKFVDFATTIFYIFAALAAVGGIGVGINGQPIGFLLGPLGAALIYVVGRVAEEISLMIVDIADATIDTAGRGRNVQGQPIAHSVVRSKPTESANRQQVPEIKQTEAVPLKDRKRPENATLNNNMYCLYLTEKFEIKENETLKKFWVRGADDMFNSLNEALNAAHEIELQEQAQSDLEILQRRSKAEQSIEQIKKNEDQIHLMNKHKITNEDGNYYYNGKIYNSFFSALYAAQSKK